MVKIANSLEFPMKEMIKLSRGCLVCFLFLITGYPVFSSEAATFV